MAGGQTIIENGRVGILFKTIWSIVASLITIGIVGIFVKMDRLSEIQGDVKEIKVQMQAQSDINAITNQVAKDERADIKRRIDELERERRARQRDNSRE